MSLQARPFCGNGIKHSCDTMRDIVLDNILYKQGCKIDTYDREKQVKPVKGRSIETSCKQLLYFFDDTMQHKACYRSEETYDKCKNERHLSV